MSATKILIPMCDRRLEYTAYELAKCGFTVYSADDSEAPKADILILPPPSLRFSSDKERFCSLLQKLKPGGWLFVGLGAECFLSEYGGRYKIADYSENKDFSFVNTAASCEGALSLIIAKTPFNLLSEKVLLTGSGRLAKYLIPVLDSLGAVLSVLARDKAFLEKLPKPKIKCYTPDDAATATEENRIIINTVPARIFPDDCKALGGKFFFELASEPYGFDIDNFRKSGAECYLAPSLPAIYSPESSGKALAKAALRIISERITK